MTAAAAHPTKYVLHTALWKLRPALENDNVQPPQETGASYVLFIKRDTSSYHFLGFQQGAYVIYGANSSQQGPSVYAV